MDAETGTAKLPNAARIYHDVNVLKGWELGAGVALSNEPTIIQYALIIDSHLVPYDM